MSGGRINLTRPKKSSVSVSGLLPVIGLMRARFRLPSHVALLAAFSDGQRRPVVAHQRRTRAASRHQTALHDVSRAAEFDVQPRISHRSHQGRILFSLSRRRPDSIIHRFRSLIPPQFQGKPPVTDLKTIRTREAVRSTLGLFLNSYSNVRTDLLTRLKYIREKFNQSPYFQTHEVSLLSLSLESSQFLFLLICSLSCASCSVFCSSRFLMLSHL